MSTTEPCTLYLGTEDGLLVARFDPGESDATGSDADEIEIIGRAVEGNAVRAISVDPSEPASAYVGCGLRGWGLYRISDWGERVESLGFEDRWVWGIGRAPADSGTADSQTGDSQTGDPQTDDPDTLYVGTEPPMVYVSSDGGETFEACAEVDNLPSRPNWTFFHEPFHAGHVHGIAVHPARPERIFAGVEHGALIYSPDGGQTWREALVGQDLHRVAVDPTDPDRVFAATGSGLYLSEDAGQEWTLIGDLRGLYLHAIVFDPDDPRRMYVYADREGTPIYRSDDGGDSWESVGGDLPAASPADTLRLYPGDSETLLYAGDVGEDGSRLFVSTDAGQHWERIDEPLPKVWRLAVAPWPED